jgi:hypothetical protein
VKTTHVEVSDDGAVTLVEVTSRWPFRPKTRRIYQPNATWKVRNMAAPHSDLSCRYKYQLEEGWDPGQ